MLQTEFSGMFCLGMQDAYMQVFCFFMSMNLDRIVSENTVCSWEQNMLFINRWALKHLRDQREVRGSLFFSVFHIKAGQKVRLVYCL